MVMHILKVPKTFCFRYFQEQDGTIRLLEERRNSVVRIGPGDPPVDRGGGSLHLVLQVPCCC